MSNLDTQRKMILTRTIPLIAVGIAFFIVYLVFFVDVNEMLGVLQLTNIPIYLLALFTTIADMAFFSLSWQYFLKALSTNVSFKKVFSYSWVSNFVDLMIPAESISGEITRILCLVQCGINTGKAAASVITHRIVGVGMTVIPLAIGALLMIIMQIQLPLLVQTLIYIIFSITAAFMFLFAVIFTKEKWAHKITDKMINFAGWITRGKIKTAELKKQAGTAVNAFYESIHVFRAKPKKFLAPLFFSIISWFLSILIYYLTFLALGYNINWIVLLVSYSVVISIKSVPFGVPAEIGVTEIAMTIIFGAFGVPIVISAAAVLLIRTITVYFRLIISFFFFQSVGIKTMIEIQRMLFHKTKPEQTQKTDTEPLKTETPL